MFDREELKTRNYQANIYSFIAMVVTFILSLWIAPGVHFTFTIWTTAGWIIVVGFMIALSIVLLRKLKAYKSPLNEYYRLLPLAGLVYVATYWFLATPSINSVSFPFAMWLKALFYVALGVLTLGLLIAVATLYLMLEANPYKKVVIKGASKVEEDSKKVVIEVSKKVGFHDAWKDFWNKFNLGSWQYYALFLTLLAIAYFSSALFNNLWTIPLGGDYTQQTIPFYTNGYDDWWHFFKTGEFPLWDSSTYLGVNNIGSNAFYYALNPFFLPILIFPRALIPQGIACLMIAKLVLAAFAMKLYLTYMGVKKPTALFFAMAYAFCGWNTYYLWFNHFMEVTVLFPLVFYGIEKVLREKKPWTLMIWLFVLGITNYFFLITVCMVGVLYAGFRYFQLFATYSVKERFGVLGLGIFGFAVGILGSAFVLLPAIYISSGSDRVTGATYLENLVDAFKSKSWNVFFDYINNWEAQSLSYDYKKFYPLITFFFPTLSDRSSALLNTSSYDNTVSSLFVYTPVMLLVVPSLLTSFREKKVSHIIAWAFILFALFTPFFYNALHGFTKEYGRWQLFVTFSLITYVALNYDKREKWPVWYFDVSFVVIILGALFTYIWAYNYQNESYFGSMEERIFDAYYEFAAIVVVYLIYRFARHDVNLTKYVTAFTALEVVIMGTITMYGHGFISYRYSVGGGLSAVSEETSIVKKINQNDDSFFRIFNSDAYKGNDNVGMRENYNGLGAFHSLYNFNTMEFNSWSHVNYNENGWSMGVHGKRYNLDAFLGVKYYIMQKSASTITYVDVLGNPTFTFSAADNVPYGYTLVPEYSTDNYNVYENNNFVELGSSFNTLMASDYYIDPETSDTTSSYFFNRKPTEVMRNEEMYLNYGILDADDFAEVTAQYPEFSTASYYGEPKAGHVYNLGSSAIYSWKTYSCTDRLPFDDFGELIDGNACSITSSILTPMVPSTTGIVVSRNDGQPLMNEAGQLTLQLSFLYNARIFLIGTDNQVITFDDHGGALNSSFKAMRSLYSDRAVQYVLIMPKSTWTSRPSAGYMYTLSDADMDSEIATYRANGFSNITHSYNEYQFDTNYTSNRFVVLNVPYDTGWSTTVTDSDGNVSHPKVYKAQGGFVGFVDPSGTNHIEVSYFTPYLAIGLVISSFGLLLGGGSYGIYYFMKKRKTRKEAEAVIQKP